MYCIALGVGKVLENMSSLSRVLFRQNEYLYQHLLCIYGAVYFLALKLVQ
ncbi:hypothetical protein APHNYW_0630 [Anaplasma phagocytophilum str. ApNYW]|nr:hypothetical protein APHNYW_0630 [Anaplasma phagocytophilum str. ApNYW]